MRLVLEEVAAGPGVVGVAVAGSFVRGEMGPYSDLDVYVLVSGEEEVWGWETRVVAGVEVEVTRGDVRAYRARIERGDAAALREVIGALAGARILRDTSGAFAALQRRAVEQMERLSLVRPASEEERASIARALSFGYRKAGNARWAGRTEAFRWEMMRLLGLVPGLVLGLAGRRVAPRPLEAMAEVAPGMHGAFARCLGAGTDAERWEALRELVRRIFAEYGLGEAPGGRGVVEVGRLTDPGELRALAEEAEAEGHGMVERLVREWASGENRFDGPGERAYVARVAGRVCGVCGLNIDPFAGDERVGRVRRLYVSAGLRRQGVGSALLGALMRDARGDFGELRLRTHDAGAAAFYEARGFVAVAGVERCTHRLVVGG
jgi:N-acetylglutamate synthase-like GNAT family acetyltransferase